MTIVVNGAAVVAWLCGTVLAAGWWKLAAFAFPPYAWYLVAELVMQLAHFERYSADCLSRTPADADLHRHLSELAGAARTLFEDALDRVMIEDGIVLEAVAGPPSSRQ